MNTIWTSFATWLPCRVNAATACQECSECGPWIWKTEDGLYSWPGLSQSNKPCVCHSQPEWPGDGQPSGHISVPSSDTADCMQWKNQNLIQSHESWVKTGFQGPTLNTSKASWFCATAANCWEASPLKLSQSSSDDQVICCCWQQSVCFCAYTPNEKCPTCLKRKLIQKEPRKLPWPHLHQHLPKPLKTAHCLTLTRREHGQSLSITHSRRLSQWSAVARVKATRASREKIWTIWSPWSPLLCYSELEYNKWCNVNVM